MISGWVVVCVALAVAGVRLAELRLARRNEAWARERGALEYGSDHYFAFFILHSAWLVAWPLEALREGPMLGPWWPLWLAAVVVAQVLRYWAIASLGRRWNTRILVLPGEAAIRRGPYRFCAHPNYVAVIIELAALPLVFGAVTTAAVASVLNLALLFGVRIPLENRALRVAAATPRSPEER